MPGTGDEIGPITLEHLLAIKGDVEGKVEELGRKMGIPEDRELILAVIQIDEIRALREQNDKLHAGYRDKDGRKLNPLKFIIGLCNYVVSELGNFLPNPKK